MRFLFFSFSSSSSSSPFGTCGGDHCGCGGLGGLPGLVHSYAIVERAIIAALEEEGSVSIVDFVDAPLYSSAWYGHAGESRRKIGRTGESEKGLVDAWLRFTFPIDLTPSKRARHTFVFATTEYLNASGIMWRYPSKNVHMSPLVTLITPSQWSREGFLRAGLPSSQVLVVPHGFSHGIRRASSSMRARARRQLGIRQDVKCLLSIGAMTNNTGMDILLRAFVKIAKEEENVHLLLKGSDALLVRARIRHCCKASILPYAIMLYTSATPSQDEMHDILYAADVYVAPYRAEGFACRP